jgi:hypothetical protein
MLLVHKNFSRTRAEWSGKGKTLFKLQRLAVKGWYRIVCEALLATQLTRSGKWRKARKLINQNTHHGDNNESIRDQSSTTKNEQGLPRQAV